MKNWTSSPTSDDWKQTPSAIRLAAPSAGFGIRGCVECIGFSMPGPVRRSLGRRIEKWITDHLWGSVRDHLIWTGFSDFSPLGAGFLFRLLFLREGSGHSCECQFEIITNGARFHSHAASNSTADAFSQAIREMDHQVRHKFRPEFVKQV